jgi:hypothetical protein
MAIKKESVDKEKREQSKKLSIIEGSFWSVMDGFGSRYITPYALALGATNFAIGLLSSLPPLLGNLAQLPVIRLMKKRKRKNIVMTSVFTQALLWLPIILAGFFYFFFKISSGFAANLLMHFLHSHDNCWSYSRSCLEFFDERHSQRKSRGIFWKKKQDNRFYWNIINDNCRNYT